MTYWACNACAHYWPSPVRPDDCENCGARSIAGPAHGYNAAEDLSLDVQAAILRSRRL